jgi:hypothetical protein
MLLPNLYARVRFCHVHWHARPRVRRAPGLPCALFQVEGNATFKPRVKHAARSRKHAQIIAIGIGGSLTAPPLPHHRTYGSVYGGSVDYAICGSAMDVDRVN